jgi:hypothetical protein
VLSLSGRLTVPFGSFGRLLVTSAARWSPRPSLKYYASGVGEIAERVVRGHHEAFQLFRVTR